MINPWNMLADELIGAIKAGDLLHKSRSRVAAEFSKVHGVSYVAVERKIQRLVNGGQIGRVGQPKTKKESSRQSGLPKSKFTDNGDDTATVDYEGRLITLPQVLEYAKIDLEVWEVSRWLFNKWEVGRKETIKDLSFSDGVIDGTLEDTGKLSIEPLIQIKVWLRRRVKELDLKDLHREIIEDIKLYAPKPAKVSPKSIPGEQHMMELDIPDLHLDKRPFDNGRDSATVELEVMECLEDLFLQTKHYPLDLIVLVASNDFFNQDGRGTTEKGTVQESFMTPREAFRFGLGLKRRIIERCRARCGNVIVPMILGNHSPDEEFRLGVALEALYGEFPDVKIDCGPGARKYIDYGISAFMYTHGSEESPNKLPLIWLAEHPESFQKSRFRFIKKGHQHRKTEVNYTSIAEDYGIILETMRALCVVDDWHKQKGYQSVRGVQASIYSRERGPRGTFESNILM